MPRLDYDTVAAAYDQRYALNDYKGTRDTILAWLAGLERPSVLEVGCGTGKWLELLAAYGCRVAGADPSVQMLGKALGRVAAELKQASAESLPWPDASFDAVLFVNSLHHVRVPRAAVREAFRVLKHGGRFLSIGLDPHARVGRWFVYEYFPQTLELDRARFPSRDQRARQLLAAGFDELKVSIAEHIQMKRTYDEAKQQGVLEPSFTSQLSLLSPEDYYAGLARMLDAVVANPALELEADLYLFATTARKP